MISQSKSLLAAEAARQLGVTIKALRLYEQHGLLQPKRTNVGYRHYSPDDLRVARDILALRALGLTLAEIAKALTGDIEAIDRALAMREAELDGEFSALQKTGQRLRELRRALALGQVPQAGELACALATRNSAVSLELPWPWGGEPLTLPPLASLTYLVGPLGSGKTRLAQLLSRTLPNAQFIGLERLDDPEKFERDLGLTDEETAAVDEHVDWLREAGAIDIAPLRLLLSALEAGGGVRTLVIDMIEHGLSRPSQEALMPLLRRHLKSRAAPVIAMTRSSSILDLSRVGTGEAILYCPANHSIPYIVAPYAGATGYEALTSCLASPEVRERLALSTEFL